MAEEKKKTPIALIIGILVFGVLLAGGISYFIATKIVTDSGSRDAGTRSAHREPGTFIKLGDAKDGLILNIGGVNSGRFLKIGLILEVKPEKSEAPTEGKSLSPSEVKILDAAVQVLRSQKIEDFEPQKQEQLKEVIKNEVNKTLGEDRVYDVYITNFVLQ
ncbi:hypothetical protein P22_2183 [Propionispora sp. 2/2-37]|uniref:flagellar basal body-associated FliL family protein n=1 Tax=Propionispora sp. 2/2-37 TaxID=1677858 RepID=UPI0006BB8916|nr:flagellar basal body-associated FliL family protein [Propionispora sp. 2/2-37]CUH96095.1 hypothetical protein P22_2183 [Propionispora sp. 2/2-37]